MSDLILVFYSYKSPFLKTYVIYYRRLCKVYKMVDGEYIMSKGGLEGTIAAASDLETIASLRERAGDSILQLELIEAEQKIVGLYAECLLGKSLG